MSEDFETEKLSPEMVERYLERIQMDLEEPSLKYLSKLIYSHQISIPFENIDVFEYNTPRLDLKDVFDKVILSERGGYCFELNSLFCALLNSLGFDAWPCLCKVCLGTDGKHQISHRGTIVCLEGYQYFCDVGFGGPMPKGALWIKNKLTQKIEDESFTAIDMDNGWWKMLHNRHDGEETCELMFQTARADDLDFVPLNQFMASPENNTIFRNILMVNIATYDGYVSLTNICLKICRNGVIETTILETESELSQTLEDYFGMRIETSAIAKRLGLASADPA